MTAALPLEQWSERDLSSAVVELARLGNWRRYHTFDSRRSNHGFPDWVFVKGDRLLFVELKSEKGVLSEQQLAWYAALAEVVNACGGHVESYVWRPRDWDRIVVILTGKQQRESTAA